MTLLAAEVQRYVHGEYMDGLLVVSTMLRVLNMCTLVPLVPSLARRDAGRLHGASGRAEHTCCRWTPDTLCPAAGKSSHCSTRCGKTDVPCFFPFLQIYDLVKFITQVDAQGLYIVIIHKGREFHFYHVIHVKFY
jgi:hypothetical protein